jgi:hypothetical protein
VWWAWLDLNQRPHPYQQSRAHRCADRRFPRSAPTVRGEVMRSCRPARQVHGTTSVVAAKLGDQFVARKVMGLPGRRGSPIKRRDRDRDQGACPTRVLWPGRMAACAASPPARARAAARNSREAVRQPGCPPGLVDRSGTLVWWRQGSPTWLSVGGRRASPATSGRAGATWGRCQASPTRLDPGWVAAGRPCLRRWLRRGRRWSCRPGSWPPAWPRG